MTSTNNQGIVAARQDNHYDIVLYLNGQPLRVGQQLNLQAFQQLSGIVLSNGQRIPPTVRLSNGQLETVNAPFGVVNLAITVQRSFYGKWNQKKLSVREIVQNDRPPPLGFCILYFQHNSYTCRKQFRINHLPESSCLLLAKTEFPRGFLRQHPHIVGQLSLIQ